MFSEKATVVRTVFFSNAELAIAVTGYPPNVDGRRILASLPVYSVIAAVPFTASVV